MAAEVRNEQAAASNLGDDLVVDFVIELFVVYPKRGEILRRFEPGLSPSFQAGSNSGANHIATKACRVRAVVKRNDSNSTPAVRRDSAILPVDQSHLGCEIPKVYVFCVVASRSERIVS